MIEENGSDAPWRLVTSICCGFVVQFVSTVDTMLTDLAHRSVRLW